jgi:hypothetical protein
MQTTENSANLDDAGQHVNLDLDEAADESNEGTTPQSSKSTKPKKFPLVPALGAVFVVVGGAMGWQWWSQHHRPQFHSPMSAQTSGDVGITGHFAPQPAGAYPAGLMAMDDSQPPAVRTKTQGMGLPAAPALTSAAGRTPSFGAPAAPIQGAVPQARTGSAPAVPSMNLQPSMGMHAVALVTHPVMAPPPAVAPSSPVVVVPAPVQQPSQVLDSALSARMDAMDKEIRRIALRLSAIQSDMRQNHAHVAAAAPKTFHGSAKIVAVNGGAAVVMLNGRFLKVSSGDSLPGFGRVIRVGLAGVQTSEGGWIKR